MKRFEGKNIIVTGSGRGIGSGIAKRLAAEGGSVIINFLENVSAAEKTANDIIADGGKAFVIQADVSKVVEVKRLFAEAEKALGKLHIVIANAGTAVIKPFVEITEADYDKVYNTNAKGVFFTMQEAAKRIEDNGRIIVISTGGVKMIIPGNSVYLGSKGTIDQLVRTLAQEIGQRNITVNAVLPGYTQTDLLPERDRKVAAGASPFKRVGQPGDIANVVAFIASEEGGWITGQEIGVGGGVF
jgi:3-oxoacyl-[acyl-carrier protein] reductase